MTAAKHYIGLFLSNVEVYIIRALLLCHHIANDAFDRLSFYYLIYLFVGLIVFYIVFIVVVVVFFSV